MLHSVASSTVCAVFLVVASAWCGGCSEPRPAGVDAAGPLVCPTGARVRSSEISASRGGGRQERCINAAGQRHGASRGYFPDGHIRYYTEWWEGKKQGRFAHWWPNGRLKAEGAHRNWQPEGLWTNWDEAGEITSQHDYATGPFPYPAHILGSDRSTDADP